MTKVLEDLYGDEIRRPSSLIELSKSELKRFEHNIIHLSGLKHNPNSKKGFIFVTIIFTNKLWF